MKNYLFLAVIAILLLSCSKYQINTISSTNTKKDVNTGDFIIENDSVQIKYTFNGESPVRVNIVNKLDQPLYVDWKRSALIVNDQALSFAGENLEIDGDIKGESFRDWAYNIFDYRNLDLDLKAQVKLPVDLSFIPPKSRVEKALIRIPEVKVKDIPKKSLVTREIATEIKTVRVKTAEFSKDDSPLTFQSYLTLFTEQDSKIRPVVFRHDFYVSEAVLTTAKPKSIGFGKARGDYFYTGGASEVRNTVAQSNAAMGR